MVRLQELAQFIRATVECSYYLSPSDPGLTYPELIEACARAGYEAGETQDAFKLSGMASCLDGSGRLLAAEETKTLWGRYFITEDPDYRNFEAFDFVVDQIDSLAKSVGAAQAWIDRQVLVQRAVAQGLPTLDVEAAITIMTLSGRLAENDSSIGPSGGIAGRGAPSSERDRHGGRGTTPKPARARAYPIVRHIIDHRTRYGSPDADPLDVFTDRLGRLDQGVFKLWWTQTASEMRRQDPASTPVCLTVLAAALVEGALTFAVMHGRLLGAFASPAFEEPAGAWTIEYLVTSAASGDQAVLNEASRQRTLVLADAGRRLHAGCMLVDFPRGIPDISPEDARDARATAEIVVRQVLDWLDRQVAA